MDDREDGDRQDRDELQADDLADLWLEVRSFGADALVGASLALLYAALIVSLPGLDAHSPFTPGWGVALMWALISVGGAAVTGFYRKVAIARIGQDGVAIMLLMFAVVLVPLLLRIAPVPSLLRIAPTSLIVAGILCALLAPLVMWARPRWIALMLLAIAVLWLLMRCSR